MMLSGCGRGSDEASDSLPEPEVLMQVGDSTLTRAQVLAQLPAGISTEDSARLFDAIVEEWMERNMLVDVAENNLPDLERIDRMVEQYRRQLLTEEYRRLMAEQYSAQVPEDSVKAYYAAHPEAFVLTAPLVKGIYVKLPAGSRQMAQVRSWVNAASPADIDHIEGESLKDVVEYDYFADQWVSWQDVSSRIPYRFDSEGWLPASGKKFETTVDGITYLVHLTAALQAGEQMPYDFARPRIQQTLAENDRDRYDRRLLQDIYRREVDRRRIHPGTYVPLRYRDPATGPKK